jgi:Dynein light chain type 1
MSDQRKAVIKNADMEDKMQQDAVDIASKALSEYNIEKVREVIGCGADEECELDLHFRVFLRLSLLR